MKNASSQSLTLLVCLILTSHFASAQDLDTVTINGRIQDQNSAVIPGALVRATLVTTGAVRSTTSDAQGRYRLFQLEPGDYKVQVSCDGFASQETTNVSVVSSRTLQLDFTLLPSTLETEAVLITSSDTPLVDTRRTLVGSTLNVREIDSLPLFSRSPLDLIFLLPGVTEEQLSTRDLAEDRNVDHATTPEESGTFSLSGAPAYSNNLTIDGLDNNDDRAARERFQPVLDAVDEVQVITNQFSAEYGRASGGRVNLRTRSGSQSFRGRVFYFFKDEALNANTFRNNSVGLPRLPLQEHDAGFTLGGPVGIPNTEGGNKTLFLVAYEHNRILDSALIDTLVPVRPQPAFPLPAPTNLSERRLENVDTPALAVEVAPFILPISTPLKTTSITARVDHQFSVRHSGSGVYQLGRSINLREFGGANRLADALQGKARNSDAVSYSDTQVLSPSFVNQIRAQFSRLAPVVESRRTEFPVVLITLNDPLASSDPEKRSGTLVAGSSTSGSSDRRENRFQLQDVLTFAVGTHSLKSGFDVHKVSSTFMDLADTTGTFNFASAGDFLAGVPERFRQNFQATSKQNNSYSGFFVQDEWQMFSQLLFSYGLRYERESIVHDLNNFGPRVSFAYSPLLSGKLVLRFGSGIFYNRALLRTIDDFTLGKQQLFFDTNKLVDPLSGKLMTAEQRRSFIATHIRFPQTLLLGSDVVKQYGNLNTNFSRRLSKQLRIPESYQSNFGVELDAGHGYSVEANFNVSRGLHLWREYNANAPVLPPGYRTLTDYLASRDFANFPSTTTALRPLYNASSAGELVRFSFAGPGSVSRIVEAGLPISVVNLNTSTSSTAIDVALAALTRLRPDPTRAELEELISAGNSFYRAMTIEARKSLNASDGAFSFMFRAGYTLSRLIDDGIVNTSDALVPGDFRAERSRSLLDRRHRFVFSGTFYLPRFLGGWQFSPLCRITSGAPFNISIGGSDRNLDDVGNDRPNFSGNTKLLKWQAPGKTVDPEVVAMFSLPAIGQSGNLPRNAGHGPGLFVLDLNVTREFGINDRVHVRPSIEIDNVLNKTVFSFGAEFINFNALSSSASPEQRDAFLDSFLVARRTMRPRQMRLGLRIDF